MSVDGQTKFREFAARERAMRPHLRAPTDAEAALFGAAIDAGAIPNGRLWREWVAGEHVLPLNRPTTTWAPYEQERRNNPDAEAACAEAEAVWQAFLSRLSGDLRDVAAQVDRERMQFKAAA
jgi:hypothetical protein